MEGVREIEDRKISFVDTKNKDNLKIADNITFWSQFGWHDYPFRRLFKSSLPAIGPLEKNGIGVLLYFKMLASYYNLFLLHALTDNLLYRNRCQCYFLSQVCLPSSRCYSLSKETLGPQRKLTDISKHLKRYSP